MTSKTLEKWLEEFPMPGDEGLEKGETLDS